MLPQVVLLTYLGLVSAQNNYCCAPDQWEGAVGFVEGYANPGYPPGSVTGMNLMHFDFTNQRVAVVSSMNAGPVKTKFRVIKDYTKKTQYTIQSDTGSCSKQALSYPMARTCAPADAIKLPTSIFGDSSNHAIVNTYILNMPTMTESFSFTQQECFPFVQALWGNFSGVPSMQVYGYMNLTQGIKDPAVFDVPSSCDTGHHQEEHHPRLSRSVKFILDRY